MENKLECEQRIWKDCRSLLGVPLSQTTQTNDNEKQLVDKWVPAGVFGILSCKSLIFVIYSNGANTECSKIIFEMSTKHYKWYKYLLSKYSMRLFHSDKYVFVGFF